MSKRIDAYNKLSGRSVLALLLTLGLSVWAISCGGTDDGEQRGPKTFPDGKADHWYSCKHHCGDRAPGGCWCDDKCSLFGDCCSDKKQQCDAPPSCSSLRKAECEARSDCEYVTMSGFPGPISMCRDKKQCEPPVCPMHMPPCVEYKKDENGCDTCECKLPCPLAACQPPPWLRSCSEQKTDSNGCQLCGCKTGCSDNPPANARCFADCTSIGDGYKIVDGQITCGCCPKAPADCSSLMKTECEARSDCEYVTLPGFPGPISMCRDKSLCSSQPPLDALCFADCNSIGGGYKVVDGKSTCGCCPKP